MSHRVRLSAEIHDGVGDAPGDVDEGKVAELPVRAVEPGRELGRELEHEAGALRRDLAEARVGHFRQFALRARADPGASLLAVREEAHLAEELALVQVGEDHLIAVLVLDHDFD